MKRKAPAFQFYPGDWLSSTKIALMTPAQEGAYIRLLCHCWSDPDCSIPDDDRSLAVLSRLGAQWKKLKAEVLDCFEPHPSIPGRLVNQKLANVREEREEFRRKQSAGGAKGADKRWHSDGSPMGKPSKPDGLPIKKGMGRDSSFTSPSPSSSSSSSELLTTSLSQSQGEPGERDCEVVKIPDREPDQNRNPDLSEYRLQCLIEDICQVTGDLRREKLTVWLKIVGAMPEGLVRRAISEVKGAVLTGEADTPPGLFVSVSKRIARENGFRIPFKNQEAA